MSLLHRFRQTGVDIEYCEECSREYPITMLYVAGKAVCVHLAVRYDLMKENPNSYVKIAQQLTYAERNKFAHSYIRALKFALNHKRNDEN